MRLFGTNGIREIVGGTLTAPFVTRVAAAIAGSVPPGAPIVVGRDARTSSFAFSRVVSGTLALAGHSVIDVGLLPTPAVQWMVVHRAAQLGVIVTASHNPPEFNGIKCIGSDGLEIPRAAEEGIEAGVERAVTPSVPFDRVGEVHEDLSGAGRYVEAILSQVDRRSVAERKLFVVLDCGNGASAGTSPALLRQLGCRTVTLNAQPDGTFPGHLSEPTETNLADLKRVVPALGADLGVAHDGDADRAVFVEAGGRFVGGEEILTLLARDAVERARGGVVVTPVSGSQAVEDAVRPLGGKVVYTRIGSPAVTRAMRDEKAVFGGEENGGLIFPDHQLARDGAMTLAAVLALVARRRATLAELLADLPRYTLLKEKIACPATSRSAVLERVAAELGRDSDRLVTLDGVKAYRDDGWLLVRPSGTEPIVRIFAESKDPARARKLADRGLEVVREAIASAEGRS